MGRPLDQLDVIIDELARPGYSNMAIDELILTNIGKIPTLRFYQWTRPEVSFGYFEKFANVVSKYGEDELYFVRRWTGGGVVDHRDDYTYSLFIPRDHKWSQLRGGKSYCEIHKILVSALDSCGVEACLTSSDQKIGTNDCFENPVTWDVMNSNSVKIAGAGQKRTRLGLLHQGSVRGVNKREKFISEFLDKLSKNIRRIDFTPDLETLNMLEQKYSSAEWMEKR